MYDIGKWDKSIFNLVSVGNLHDRKAHDILVRIAEQLNDEDALYESIKGLFKDINLLIDYRLETKNRFDAISNYEKDNSLLWLFE